MPNVTGADLTRYAAAINKSLLDSATNTRTNAVLPCRLDAEHSQIRLGGLQSPEARVPSWDIVFQRDVDVKSGDSITVTGRGTFMVLRVDSPVTYDTALIVNAVMTARADGSWPVTTNATVTFRKAGNPALTIANAKVLIEPNWKHAWLNSLAAQYEWIVLFQSSLHYTDNSLIALGDQIVWSYLDDPGFATLQLPDRDLLLGYTTAYFNAVGQTGQGI